MNLSSLPSVQGSSPDLGARAASLPPNNPARRRSLRSLLGTITGICFVFGALLAVQLRTIKNIQSQRVQKSQNDALQKQIAEKNRLTAVKAQGEAQKARAQLTAALNKLKSSGTVSVAQINALTSQIRDLQALACLTPVTGRGIRIVLNDNPQAGNAAADKSQPLTGIVHDYDVLQVVNELRSAKAQAIAVSGADGKPVRITATTPIRCVGPVIFINWQPVAAPFSIEAIGQSATLKSALEMPGGIVENMRNYSVDVKVATVNGLTLPPGDAAPNISASSSTGIPASLSTSGITSLAPKGT